MCIAGGGIRHKCNGGAESQRAFSPLFEYEHVAVCLIAQGSDCATACCESKCESTAQNGSNSETIELFYQFLSNGRPNRTFAPQLRLHHGGVYCFTFISCVLSTQLLGIFFLYVMGKSWGKIRSVIAFTVAWCGAAICETQKKKNRKWNKINVLVLFGFRLDNGGIDDDL